MAIYMWREKEPEELCFTANTANSKVTLNKTGSPTAVTLETSTDGSTWISYTFGNAITLSNVGDNIYFRNTSETTTGFSTSDSNYYYFDISGDVDVSGDITYLVNKNSTDTLTSTYCFYFLFYNQTAIKTSPSLPATTLTNSCYRAMFYGCTGLKTAPSLPATTLKNFCYASMFNGCTNLEELPRLPALAMVSNCYNSMFQNCSKIGLSTTQTGEYQTEYRVPTVGTGTIATSWNNNMFYHTGGTITNTIAINTTYYTSNTVI